MSAMRIIQPSAVLALLCACAGAPPAAPVPAAATLQRVTVEGPGLDLDWDKTLHGFAGTEASPRTLAEIEATVAEAYVWADWREVQTVAAPEPDDHGTLRVSVYAEPPLRDTPAPAALPWPPPETVPPPVAAAGARMEADLDPVLAPWQQSASRVLIDRSERRLYLKRANGGIVSYPVAVGTARTPTPAGEYLVEAIRNKPTWYPPASIRRAFAARGKTLPDSVPPGPGNPLGEWFVRLQGTAGSVSATGIGIHGTNQPRSIGRAASFGCVRMHDSDVKDVVAQLRRGDGVTVVHTRAALLARR